MFTIKTLNAISPVGLAKLNKNLFDVSVGTDAPDGILVRSADLLNTTFHDNLLAIARAGAGVNNIPLDRCSEQGIVVFNTPGANANAVAELVIGMLIAGSRNVADAAQWTQGLAGDAAMAKSVEKGKKQFVGNEIKGKTLGVVGLGAIGSRVANCAIALGMEAVESDIMDQKPRPRDEGIFAHGLGLRVILQGVMFAVLTLIGFVIGENAAGTLSGGQTMAFLVLSLSQIVQAYNMRSDHSLFRIGPFSNRNLNLACLASFLLVALVLFTPVRTAFGLVVLPAQTYLTGFALTLVPIVVMELSKAFGLIKHQH